ncbi:unnamed protein product [Absidia cylindrospora]
MQQIHQLQQLQKLQQQLQQLQQEQRDDDKNGLPSPTDATGTQATNAKRSIDSTDESDANLTTTPKRPGRKPLEKAGTSDLTLDPKQKRKAQNRAAQRAFRERKEKHVSELQERIRELEEMTSKTDANLVEENNKLKEQLKKLEEENYALKDAKFTFQFPLSDQQNSNATSSPTTSPSSSSSPANSTDLQDDPSGGSSSSSTEQSPLSLAQEDDSDTPIPKSSTNLQGASAFASFGSIPASQDFDFLAVPGGGNGSINSSTSPYDFKELFQNKGDLFTEHRAPAPATTAIDELFSDDFTVDNNTGLPALFGGSDDLFGFTSQQQEQHGPLLLDTFYMPSDPVPRPHLRKETLEASLQRSRHEGRPAFEIHQQIKNCPDFDLDGLCSDLKEKASCSESKYVLSEYDVEAYLNCFGQK